tara:strand:- start:49979 stop:51232 length:1254 start_codon:yes stop_codon:yes gene_type:complete
MKVLVIGSGGREHAIVKTLEKSVRVSAVIVTPGRPSFASDKISCIDLPSTDGEVLAQFCKSEHVELVVVGPEVPLVAGVADTLRSYGVSTVGPGKVGAQLEGSKVFSKKFMEKYGVPTAPFVEVSSVEDVKSSVKEFTAPYVLKADGLAAGKGVYICKTEEELFASADELFNHNIFGDAGRVAILEQFQPGWELSYIGLCNGKQFEALPLSQDHKRLLDNDEGPNTGGMGVVGPLHLKPELIEQIESEVVEPTLKGIRSEDMLYNGILYIGLMITEEGPKVIEYNVRFGDPETQIILPLTKNDWGEVFLELSQGNLVPIQPSSDFATCVVVAAEGYPVKAIKGAALPPLPKDTEKGFIFHAGVGGEENQLVVDGGRVLNVVALGESLGEARDRCYGIVEQVRWVGSQIRTDIGKKVL